MNSMAKKIKFALAFSFLSYTLRQENVSKILEEDHHLIPHQTFKYPNIYIALKLKKKSFKNIFPGYKKYIIFLYKFLTL